MKVATKKGFTLIELMVVMAIISVLAVTLVPQLTWAQARSRDAGRVATLKNFSAVLETYLSDEGYYPRAPQSTTDIAEDGDGCFSSSDGTVNNQLAEMLKWWKAQTNPQRQSTSGPCTIPGAYGYVSVTKDGIYDNGYMLISDIETYKKANADWSQFSWVWTTFDSSFDYTEVQANVPLKLTAELSPASNSVFIETN